MRASRAVWPPADFTIRTIFSRLAQVGDLWAGLREAEPADLEAVF